MIKKLVVFALLTSLFPLTFSQNKGNIDPWQVKGFDFFIGGGIYAPDKSTANYYNGAPNNEVNLNLLFDNQYRFDEIALLVRNNYPYVDSMWLGEYPKNMSYKIGMNFGIGVKYKFHKNWGLSLNYSHVQVTASDIFLIMFDQPAGNQRNNYAIESIIAKEERSFIELNITHLFHNQSILRPFLELGIQFNFLKVRSFEAIIEDQPFNLLSSVSTVYVPGVQDPPNYRSWSAPGYGALLTGGVKFVFNEMFSLDPAFTFSVSSLGHSDNLSGFYSGLTFNYALMIRLVLSDLYFNRNR